MTTTGPATQTAAAHYAADLDRQMIANSEAGLF